MGGWASTCDVNILIQRIHDMPFPLRVPFCPFLLTLLVHRFWILPFFSPAFGHFRALFVCPFSLTFNPIYRFLLSSLCDGANGVTNVLGPEFCPSYGIVLTYIPHISTSTCHMTVDRLIFFSHLSFFSWGSEGTEGVIEKKNLGSHEIPPVMGTLDIRISVA